MNTSTDKNIQQLEQQFNLPGITFKQHHELIAVHIENDSSTATIFLQGAQLTHFQPQGNKPIIWLSDECDYASGKPLRGGIPICWPWFGDLDKNPETIQNQFNQQDPAHGLVRDKLWTIQSIQHQGTDTTELIFGYHFSQNPFDITLNLRFIIGKTLSLELTTHNAMPSPFHYSAALHTYFSIDAINKVEVNGLQNKPYVDSLQNWQHFTQSEPLHFQQEVDRIYSNIDQAIHITETQSGRTITLSQENAKNLVAWNPWIEKSKRLSNFSDNAYQSMLCLETAQVLENAVTLAPNAQDTIVLNIH